MELREVKKGSFIYQVEQCMDVKLCKELITKFNSDSRVQNGVTFSGYDPEIKKTLDLQISRHPDWAELDSRIFAVTGEVIKTISKDLPYMLHDRIRDTGYKIGMYEAGDGFKLHSDQFENRRTVIMWYLNTVDEGGETEFPLQDIIIKPEEGKMLLFPASWTHLHQGNPSVSGRKYILNTWLI